jgi:thioredoxin-related protein
MKKVKFFLTIPITMLFAVFTINANAQIHWLSVAQAQEAYKANPKPLLIDLYTSWCGWCKEMDRTTFKNAKVAAYVNEHYYAVKYDAESRAEIPFNGKSFSYNPSYKVNDLAIYLSLGELSYPSLIFLPTINAKPAPLAGYMKPKELEAPLKYFAERASAQETFIEFNRKMKRNW